MKFLITGANGFIGSNLVDKLIDEHHEVRALILRGTDESNLNKNKDKIEKVYGDVTDIDSIKDLFDGVDIVIHLAARVNDWGPKKLFMKINFQGSKNVLDAAVAAGVKRFIFMSSLTVHGFKEFQDADENTPYDPCNAYAESKKAVEDLLNQYFNENKIETVIVRPGFVIFGPRDVLFSFEAYDRICKNGSFPCVNHGKAISCYSYVENLVDGLILVSTHPNAAGKTYIISDGPIISFKELMDDFFKSCNVKIKLQSAPYWLAISAATILEGIYKLFRRKNGPIITRYRVKVSASDLGFINKKIVSELGYNAKINLEEACKRTYEWYMNKIKNE
ncbi:MAG: NAD-dependent epimerase/dehydratase family protein [Candidatus Helarchaeota archaeon]